MKYIKQAEEQSKFYIWTVFHGDIAAISFTSMPLTFERELCSWKLESKSWPAMHSN